jgi:hypothetical protein
MVRREEYDGLEVGTKVELTRTLILSVLMHVQRRLDDGVAALAGARHARQDSGVGTGRGRNPGTVRLLGQRFPIWMPRGYAAGAASSRCGRMRRCMTAMARLTGGYSGGSCTGSR